MAVKAIALRYHIGDLIMIYAIATLNVKNPEKLAEYREVASEALARHGGAVVTASAAPLALEGSPELADATALLSFPDKQAGLNWINDPDLSEVHSLRQSAGQTAVILLA